MPSVSSIAVIVMVPRIANIMSRRQINSERFERILKIDDLKLKVVPISLSS